MKGGAGSNAGRLPIGLSLEGRQRDDRLGRVGAARGHFPSVTAVCSGVFRWMAGATVRTFPLLFCLVHAFAIAGEDPALAETARRLQMPVEVVKQHYQAGCDSGRPSEQFICASYGLTVEEMALERVYGTLVSELKDKGSVAKLESAQKAWSVFRDAACDFEADGYSRGRDLDTVVAGCKASYTKARSGHLKTFLGCGEQYGCPGYK